MPVVSAAAAPPPRLLPSISPSIRRSRFCSRRLTIPACLFSCFSSRAMLARDDAVSAVSLPAKKAEHMRQTRTTARESQSAAVMAAGDSAGQKCAHLGGIDVVFDKSAADAAHKNEGERAALHFLVLRDQIHQDIDIRDIVGHLLEMGRQADPRKMCFGLLGFGVFVLSFFF